MPEPTSQDDLSLERAFAYGLLGIIAVAVIITLFSQPGDDSETGGLSAANDTLAAAEKVRSGDETTSSQSGDSQSSAATQTPPPSSLHAQAATAAQLDNISGVLEDGIRVTRGWRRKSSSHKRGHWVAAVMRGPGIDGTVGVWLVGGTPDAPGMTLPADGVASEFSVARPARETDAWGYGMHGDVMDFKAWAERQ